MKNNIKLDFEAIKKTESLFTDSPERKYMEVFARGYCGKREEVKVIRRSLENGYKITDKKIQLACEAWEEEKADFIKEQSSID